MKRVLFICTGNICRSPTADGMARQLAAQRGLQDVFEFDSAGTHAYHTGEAPDPRAQLAARKRGYELSELRARPVVPQDFEDFDLILAMDRSHLTWLKRESPREHHHKIRLFLSFAEGVRAEDVPDPYYGGRDGFEYVLDLCEAALQGLLAQRD
jgi:protein-tyrosine phosphatase